MISAVPSVQSKCDSRKRKQKRGQKEAKGKKSKDGDAKEAEGSSLSHQDKQMLERWTKMQTSTTPFVHPIRKHMQELIKIKSETISVDNTNAANAPAVGPTESGPKTAHQVTNYMSLMSTYMSLYECLNKQKLSPEPSLEISSYGVQALNLPTGGRGFLLSHTRILLVERLNFLSIEKPFDFYFPLPFHMTGL